MTCASRGAGRGEEDGVERARLVRPNATAEETGGGSAHLHAILPGRRGHVCGGLHPLFPFGVPDVHPDGDHYGYSHGYSNHHSHADGHTTAAAPTKPNSCADEHGHACANKYAYACADSYPYAYPATDGRTHPDRDHALNAAAPVGSVSQLNKQRPAPIGRRSLLKSMLLLNHPWQCVLLLGPLAAWVDTRQAQ
jgi:hypothetical protein